MSRWVAGLLCFLVIGCEDRTAPPPTTSATAKDSGGQATAPSASASGTTPPPTPRPVADAPGRVAIWNYKSITKTRAVSVDGKSEPLDLGKGVTSFFVIDGGRRLLMTISDPLAYPKRPLAYLDLSTMTRSDAGAAPERFMGAVSESGHTIILRSPAERDVATLRDLKDEREVSLPDGRCAQGPDSMHPSGKRALVTAGDCDCLAEIGKDCVLDLWELDLERGAPRKLRSGGDHFGPTYGWDGRIYYSTTDGSEDCTAGKGDCVWNVASAPHDAPDDGKLLVRGASQVLPNPYADQIAHVVRGDGKRCKSMACPSKVFVAKRDGSGAREVFSHPTSLSVHSFSRDGKWLLVSITQTSSDEMPKAHVCPVDSGDCVSLGKGMARGWIAK